MPLQGPMSHYLHKLCNLAVITTTSCFRARDSATHIGFCGVRGRFPNIEPTDDDAVHIGVGDSIMAQRTGAQVNPELRDVGGRP
eukprot:6207847-Pleurochrysis_carterae.AAC.1